ncbi:MAG: carnitine dehydratase [Deltaproteobacteria bacterium RBG_13_43_22]|nr:MAG: carnitine dehydratase [Deltaproteobacteria bacterium RBG_13_43_22]
MAGPLQGLKILDFTTLLPGPYATMMLSDLGAEVLRIVSGSRPDLTTMMPPLIGETGISSSSAYLGRGKRSMTLNLKDPRGVRIVQQLITTYDILIEQFRPGVMAKFGLDYPKLTELNPRLIYCSLTGYGQTGPMTGRAGHDINYLSRSGLMSYSGRKETGPVLTGMQIADIASGSYNSIIGLLSAVIYRQTTGQGQFVDISMTDGMIAFTAMVGASFLVNGHEPGREGHLLNGGSLYDFYETKDGQYISFGGLEPQFFAAFCQAIDRPDLIPGGVLPPNVRKVKQEVRDIIKTKTRDEWTVWFQQYDACVEPVLTLFEALNDHLVQDRGMVVEVPLPDGGRVKQIASPIKFSETPPQYDQVGLPVGTHTKEILLELGYSEQEIREFGETGLFN